MISKRGQNLNPINAAAEKRNAWNGQFWSFKVLLKFNLPSKIASKISKLALFAATLPRKTYTFTVGYHELTGTKVPLKKPMLVLKKIKLDIEEEKGDINLSRVELDVIGVIRQRTFFKKPDLRRSYHVRHHVSLFPCLLGKSRMSLL